MYTCALVASNPMGSKLDPDAHLKPKKHDVTMAAFRQFVNRFWETLDENQCDEVFMLMTKKLANLLLSPSKIVEVDEDQMDNFEDTIG